MVPFAGYDMPVQYPTGILAEHNWTRGSAGLFDVSHMGQRPCGRVGTVADAAKALERLVPRICLGLQPRQQRYAQFAEDGGTLDDLMIAHAAEDGTFSGRQCVAEGTMR